MVLKINGKEYLVRFGFKAIDYLDHQYTIETQGIKILGQGIQQAYTYLYSESVIALYHVIRAATITEKTQPSAEEIEAYAEELAVKNELSKLFEELIDELKKQPLTKGTVAKHEKSIKTAEKEAKKKA